MRLNETDRRRVLGAVFLSLAVLMLVAGQTILQGRLGNLATLIYWLFCMVFTVLAMMIALVDLRAVRRSTRQAQRDMLQGMVKDIADEQKRGKSSGPRDTQRPHS